MELSHMYELKSSYHILNDITMAMKIFMVVGTHSAHQSKQYSNQGSLEKAIR